MASSSPLSPLKVSIASFNIACSRKDEKFQPLYARLPIIWDMISSAVATHGVNIICLQEVRETGEMSAYDVIAYFASKLKWDFHSQRVNPSAREFCRVTMWDPSAFHHCESIYTHTPNTKLPEKPFMAMKSYFTMASSKDMYPTFSVINAHAPVNKEDKLEYWRQVLSLIVHNKHPSIAIGDFNKFNEDIPINNHQLVMPALYAQMLKKDPNPLIIKDWITQKEVTFTSYDNDRQPSGELWVGALDGILTDVRDKLEVNHSIIPTTDKIKSPVDGNEYRASDHYLILASFELPR